MRRLVKMVTCSVCALALFVVAGCGDGGDGQNDAARPAGPDAGSSIVNDLAVLGLVYHDYHDAHRQGPPGWDEAIRFAAEHSRNPAALERVRAAGYQVKWGKRLRDVTAGTANTVLAESGSGPRLMFDGSVQQ